jgi:CheY-like chemotaxis protein
MRSKRSNSLKLRSRTSFVMDLKMPGDGQTATAHVRQVYPKAEIVAVTAFADPSIAPVLKEKYKVDAPLPKDELFE